MHVRKTQGYTAKKSNYKLNKTKCKMYFNCVSLRYKMDSITKELFDTTKVYTLLPLSLNRCLILQCTFSIVNIFSYILVKTIIF